MSWSEQNSTSSTYGELSSGPDLKWPKEDVWNPPRFYSFIDRTWSSTVDELVDLWKNYKDESPTGYLFKSLFSEQNTVTGTYSETQTENITWSEL
tara:strand:+ start:11350 stop:11634 length:285 start_codon:yes stop_codon:yes gene_type:complete